MPIRVVFAEDNYLVREGTAALLETNGEGLFLFARVEPFLAAIRNATSPRVLKNAEWISTSCELAKGIMTTFRGRVQKKIGK